MIKQQQAPNRQTCYVCQAHQNVKYQINKFGQYSRIYPAFNHTFVCSINQQRQIAHINSKGVVIKSIKLGNSSSIYGYFQMFSNDELLCQTINYIDNQMEILYWNLQTYYLTTRKIKKKNNCLYNFITFYQSKLICLVQDERGKQNQTLRYHLLKYPIEQGQIQPDFIEIKGFSNITSLILRQINNSSKIGWYQHSIDKNQSVIYIFDVIQGKQLKQYRIYHDFNTEKQLFSVYLTDIWEILQNKVYLKYKIKLSKEKYKAKYGKNYDNKIIQKLILKEKQIEFIWSPAQNKLQTPLFSHDDHYCVQFIESPRIVNNYRKVEQLAIQISDFKSMWRKPTIIQTKKIPIYYVSFKQQKIIHKIELSKIQKSCYSKSEPYQKNLFLQYQPSVFVTYVQQEEEIKIKYIKVKQFIYPTRLFYSFFISQFIQNCDQTLLSEILEILPEQKQEFQMDYLKWEDK